MTPKTTAWNSDWKFSKFELNGMSFSEKTFPFSSTEYVTSKRFHISFNNASYNPLGTNSEDTINAAIFNQFASGKTPTTIEN